MSHGTVFFQGVPDNKIYAVDAETGEEKWSFATGRRSYLRSPLLVSGDGDTVLFGEQCIFDEPQDCELYAIISRPPLGPRAVRHRNSGLCLSLAGGDLVTGAQPVLGACSDVNGQEWTIHNGQLIKFEGEGEPLRYCLDAQASGDVLRPYIYPCMGTPSQHWVYSAKAELSLANANFCMQRDALLSDGAVWSLVLRSCAGIATQQWDVPDAGAGQRIFL